MTKTFVIPALVLDVFAVALVVAGLIAYFNAPPGASAATAIIIPAVAAGLIWIAGLLTLAGIKKPKLGRIGYTMGFVLAVVFTGLLAFTAYSRQESLTRYPAAKQAWQEQLVAGTVAEQDRDTFFRQRRAPRHDTTYLVNTLWTMTAISLLAAFGLLGVRPRPTAPPPPPAPTP